jgi:hypothetical protein
VSLSGTGPSLLLRFQDGYKFKARQFEPAAILCKFCGNFFRNTAARQGPSGTAFEQIAQEISTRPHGTVLRGLSRRRPEPSRFRRTMATKPVVDFRAWAAHYTQWSSRQARTEA